MHGSLVRIKEKRRKEKKRRVDLLKGVGIKQREEQQKKHKDQQQLQQQQQQQQQQQPQIDVVLAVIPEEEKIEGKEGDYRVPVSKRDELKKLLSVAAVYIQIKKSRLKHKD